MTTNQTDLSYISDLPALERMPETLHIGGAGIIVAPGFEDRTLALPNVLLPEQGTTQAVVVTYSNWHPNNRVDDVIKELERKAVQVTKESLIEYDRYNPDSFADALQGSLERQGITKVLLDISTMSKLAILLCLNVLCEINADVTLFYAEAGEYGPSQEEYRQARAKMLQPSIQVHSGVGSVIRAARLSSVALQGEPSAAIAFMSLNELLTQALINAVYPSRLFLINGRPPVFTWREEATAWIHEKLGQEWPLEDNPLSVPKEGAPGLPLRVCSTLQYAEATSTVLDLYWKLSNQYRVILAPTGSKMQTVGAFVAKALHPDIHIEYPTPKGFLPSYSKGVGAMWTVRFGPIGKFIERLRESETAVQLELKPV